MKIQYHILNGDALKEQFPESIPGEMIIMRECLVDGDVQGDTLDDLFKTRAKFISSHYPAVTEEDYILKTSQEFGKVTHIPEEADINLWFEDDLFCQVNFWFMCFLLDHHQKDNPVFLVRPTEHTQYGFANYTPGELPNLLHDRISLSSITPFKDLWLFYQKSQTRELLDLAKILTPSYPFILPAVQAHIDRIPQNGSPSRPMVALKQIMDDLQTDQFGPVFQAFSKQESIYGFGDLQVKRLFDELVK